MPIEAGCGRRLTDTVTVRDFASSTSCSSDPIGELGPTHTAIGSDRVCWI